MLTMLALAAAGVGCRAPSRAPDVPSLPVIGEQYVRLTLELAQHQPSLVERWLGPPAWRPGPRRPVAAIRDEIATLQQALNARAEGGEDAPRQTYLQRQITSLDVAARRLTGESMSFIDEARGAFGDRAAALLSELEDAGGVLASARAELNRRLPGRGPLHERYAAFRTAHAIAPGRLGSTLQSATEYCRERVRAEVPLPDEERVELEVAHGLGLEGLAVYDGRYRSRVQIDTSSPIDLARVVWLVAHETYPGHHLQHVLCDRDLVLARGWSERALYPAFGSHLLVSEGAAEAGAALLLEGPRFDEICRMLARTAGTPGRVVEDLVAVHRAVTGLDLAIARVAGAYLDHTLEGEPAAEALTAQALVPNGRQLLSIIERQRTRVLSYPIGRRLVSAHVFSASANRRWDALAQVASTLVLP